MTVHETSRAEVWSRRHCKLLNDRDRSPQSVGNGTPVEHGKQSFTLVRTGTVWIELRLRTVEKLILGIVTAGLRNSEQSASITIFWTLI